MIEKALTGNKQYWGWITILVALIAIGTVFYLRQFSEGLGITGLRRDVPWGFYIAQFTFLVGIAASAVMVVLPYYLHNYKAFGKITVLGEFVAISAVLMCMTFIFVDMGQPFRIINVFLHPTLNSMMFWDTVALGGYLFLNILISRVTFASERKGIAPPKWIKPFIIVSIPWAVSIHTVTAFLYSGLEGRAFWLTAILAPRFLASAFSSGPALLIILVLIVRKFSRFDTGNEPIRKLGEIVAYAMAVNVFFVLVEVFTGIYSDIPHHVHHFEYLVLGYQGGSKLVPWMWVSYILAALSLVLLLVPSLRRNMSVLVTACVAVVVSLWIDKGLGMVITGFVPNPFGEVVEYWPTVPEVFITLGVYAFGFLILTVLYKVAVGVREEVAGYR